MSDLTQIPTVVHTGTMDLCGFTLTVHNLSNGERVFEDNAELRRLLAWLTDGTMSLAEIEKALEEHHG